VLVYHDVTATPSEFQRMSGGFVTPQTFEEQVRWLGTRFRFIAPTDLPQLGGDGKLPTNAALVTFDDAWAGVFRTALPILSSLSVPALCFLNMATVQGTPDLAAVRRYERDIIESPSCIDSPMDSAAVEARVANVQECFATDGAFLRFQGATATPDDLQNVIDSGWRVWYGSHLLHHWDLRAVAEEVMRESIAANAASLAAYPNVVPALATPYGVPIDTRLARQLGVRVIFVATGSQNRTCEGEVLDRLELEPQPSSPSEWWWSLHRRRLFGGNAG
jgi:peptidoglycan/xylan/chitin deacetylase (PgdA/CDA1 family)